MSKFSSLKSSYGEFLAPDYTITVDGKDIKKSLMIGDLSVDLGMNGTGNACRFSIGQFYEIGSRSISSAVQSSLVLGKTVKVSMGYGGSLTPIFTGFLSNLSFNFSGGMSMNASCIDARAMMRQSENERSYENVTEKQVIEKIFAKYKSLVKSNSITMDNLSAAGTISVKTDDLKYILDETQKRDLLFYIDDDKACISKPSGKVCVEFDWGDFGISFSMNYQNKKFTGVGYDIQSMQSFSVKAESKQQGKQTDCIVPEVFQDLPPFVTKEMAQKLIDALAKGEKRNAQTSKVDCVGLPDVKLGQMVKFNNFPLLPYTKKDQFLVTSVSHSMSESGYKTSFDVALGD